MEIDCIHLVMSWTTTVSLFRCIYSNTGYIDDIIGKAAFSKYVNWRNLEECS